MGITSVEVRLTEGDPGMTTWPSVVAEGWTYLASDGWLKKEEARAVVSFETAARRRDGETAERETRHTTTAAAAETRTTRNQGRRARTAHAGRCSRCTV